ncbi:MAG TPA: twin-arginine translocation signal domain-containing protein, partial [Longimicrobium sp.]|nr:twin-arginine translocation signal domain-containing protein [Longimicrobium sp.]
MSEPSKWVTRRTFLQHAALGAGSIMVSGAWQFAFASSEKALIDSVGEACRRLAPLGWRQLLLDVTAGGL